MLQTDLIDLVNGGDVWALVGSGPSIDGGGPSWESLARETALHLEAHHISAIEDGRFSRAVNRNDFFVSIFETRKSQ